MPGPWRMNQGSTARRDHSAMVRRRWANSNRPKRMAVVMRYAFIGSLLGPQIRQLAAHFVEVDQGPIHHELAGADFGGGNGGVGAIAALGRALNRREILLIVVAISQEQHMLQARPLFQAQRMPAKKLPRYSDEPDLAIQKRRRQVGTNAFGILPVIEIH